ncbi:MAG: arsenate reductase (glutaredoxin) [Magnetospiraceae bacterium]
MTVTIYHNPRCSKSRQTLQLLQENGVDPTIVAYLETPPSAAEFKAILGKLGLAAKQVMRKKEAKEEGIDLDQAEDALIAAMVAHPRVIERPIVVKGDKAALGRPPESVLDIL